MTSPSFSAQTLYLPPPQHPAADQSFSSFSHLLISKSESKSCSVMPDSLRLRRLYSPWNSSGQNTGVDSLPLLQGIFNPGIEPRSPILQGDSLSAEPQGKPKNTGVGSLSLLQRIFLTQELNWGRLHCRQILYQLSYQGSPFTRLL